MLVTVGSSISLDHACGSDTDGGLTTERPLCVDTLFDTSSDLSYATVGGAGLCVSAVAVHGKLAGEARHRPLCSAASSTMAAPVAGIRARKGGGMDKEGHLENEDIMVYQYKICPFCNKLKAVMDYLGIPYKVTEVRGEFRRLAI